MSVSKITEGEEVKRSTLSAQLNGNSAVSGETLGLFMRKFPDVSAEWLMRGTGTMYAADGADALQNNIQGNNNSHNTQIAGTTDTAQLALKDQEIALLRQERDFLKEQIEFYKTKH